MVPRPSFSAARRTSAAGKPSKSKRATSMASKPPARTLGMRSRCCRSNDAVQSSVLIPNFMSSPVLCRRSGRLAEELYIATEDRGRVATLILSMPQLLQGKKALVLGVANRWSLAYAIAQAFVREGAGLVLTYQGDRQKLTVEELAHELSPSQGLPLRRHAGRPARRAGRQPAQRPGASRYGGALDRLRQSRGSQPAVRRDLSRRLPAGPGSEFLLARLRSAGHGAADDRRRRRS